jgi:hypothetical protein
LEDCRDVANSFIRFQFRLFLNALLVVFVNHGQEHVHQEEEANDEEDNEVQTVNPFVIIGRQHDVWEVARSQQDDQLVKCFSHTAEVLVTLETAFEEEVTH